MNHIRKLLDTYQTSRPFSDSEAWALFRMAAFAEAVGWTLLIIGILCKKLPVSWNQYPVYMAGSVHGTLFLLYIIAVLALASSLQWSVPRTFIAGLCSVPPYGSLLYEMWSSRQRGHQKLQRLSRTACYVHLINAIS